VEAKKAGKTAGPLTAPVAATNILKIQFCQKPIHKQGTPQKAASMFLIAVQPALRTAVIPQ
jgi:hypothetical protein